MRKFFTRWREEIISGLVGGLLLALAFPPFPTRFLSIVALVPLLKYFIVRAEKAGHPAWKPYLKGSFIAGYAFGVAFFLTLLYWTTNLIPASSARMPWILFPALVLLVVYLSCYTGLFALGLGFMVRRFGAAGLFAAAGLWGLAEIARSTGELAFSWGSLPYSLAVHPVAIQSLSVYGPFGLSVVMALVSLLLAVAVFSRRRIRRIAAGAAAVAIAAGHLAWGVGEMSRIAGQESGVGEIAGTNARDTGTPRGEKVVIVQPNTDLAIKWLPAYRDSIFRDIERLTHAAARTGAGLVIFPETAAPISLSLSKEHRKWLMRIADEADVDLVIGYVDHSYKIDHWISFNSAGLFDRTGRQTGHYSKINLLPFGERIPWSQYLPLLGKLDFGQANFVPGGEPTQFGSRAGRFGVLICYESIFSDFTRRYVLGGADFLVNITNDGWFGSRIGPMQHAEMAILRAVENRVTLVRSANTGISMHVDPAGRIMSRIGLDAPGMIEASISKRRESCTFYTRHGNLAFWVMAAVSLAAGPIISLLRKGK